MIPPKNWNGADPLVLAVTPPPPYLQEAVEQSKVECLKEPCLIFVEPHHGN